MAQLKDTTIQGSLSITGQLLANSNPGTNGQVLKSDGSSSNIYWGSIPTFNGAVDSSSTLFAPTSAGTEGQLLFSAGAGNAPIWDDAKLMGAKGNRQANVTGSSGSQAYGIRGNSLEMLTTNNTWASLAVTPNGTSNTNGAKSYATCEFLLHSPILYQKTDRAVAVGATNTYAEVDGYLTAVIDLKSSLGNNSTWDALNASQPVYLIGQSQNNRTFKLVVNNNNKCWTQTLPSTNDGCIYIYLGLAINETKIYLHSEHPIYSHNGHYIENYNGTEIKYGTTAPTNAMGKEGAIYYHLSETPPAAVPSTTGHNAGEALKIGDNFELEWGTVSGSPEYWDTSNINNIQYFVTGFGPKALATGSSQDTSDTSDYSSIFDTSIYIQQSQLYGAAWNDYAEFRDTHEEIQPGRCIVENGDGTLSLSTRRMQPGAEIVSDTFGFSIGKTGKCQAPIAVSGRVLAYGDKPAYKFNIGAPVCAGINGTISEMTEEEARRYPWLIIGTVSSIPQELYWGPGNVKVDGRVWIRVR